MPKLTLAQAAQYGFMFPTAKAFYDRNQVTRLAMDAALQTTPNTAVPVEFLIYLDPMVIEILTAKRAAREIYGERKLGSMVTSSAKFGGKEFTGKTTPYSDFAGNGTSGVNYNWLERDNYLYQTVIEYGDLEQEVSGEAKLNLAADKQQAAANIIDIDTNKFYFYGVAGKRNYGILNEPNLLPALTPAPVGTSSSPLWKNKTPVQVYEDVLALFQQLAEQSGGHITSRDGLKLIVSPAISVMLAKATEFNISVMDMLNKYFSRLEVVTAPEMSSATTGETIMLIASEVMGQPTGDLGFSEKIRAGRIVPNLSSFSQKFSAGCYGFVLYRSYAIATMRGV